MRLDPRIKEEVSRILTAAPVKQDDLVWAVEAQLGLVHHAHSTIRRRCKEAVSALVAEGVPIVSDRRGYRIAADPEERKRGRKFLIAQIRSLAKRLEAFDRTAGEQLGQLLLQYDNESNK